MNGFFFFATILYLIFRRLGRYSEPLFAADFFLLLQKSLRARDYLFKEILPRSDRERLMIQEMIRGLKQGRLPLNALEELDVLQRRVRQQQEGLKSLLWTYVTHLSFVLMTALLFRLGLKGQWVFDESDFAELIVAAIGLVSIALILIRVWPQSGLTREKDFLAYVFASLGASPTGDHAWVKSFTLIDREAWVSGFDGAGEKRLLLKDWQESQIIAFEKRTKVLEDALGPLELLTSCYFGACLLGLPLLSHFSGLVVS